MRMPMFGFLALGFLFFATIVAVACYLVFKSGEQGKTKLSGCAGCAIGFGLLCLAGVGAFGCTAIVFLDRGNEALRHGPIKSFEWHWPPRHEHAETDSEDKDETPNTGESTEPSKDESTEPSTDESAASDGDFGLRVVIRGSSDYASIAGRISRWLHEHTEGDITVRTHVRTEGGEQVTELEFELPASAEQLDEIRSDLERDVTGSDLPEGVKVEIKSSHDD